MKLVLLFTLLALVLWTPVAVADISQTVADNTICISTSGPIPSNCSHISSGSQPESQPASQPPPITVKLCYNIIDQPPFVEWYWC